MRKILLVVLALILYGSFYPWRFQFVHLAANPFWLLAHSWPSEFDKFFYRDAAVNIALYVPFGVFGFLSGSESRSFLFRAGATVLAATALSASIEMAQLFAPGRVCSLFDVTTNASGALVGVLLASAFPAVIHRAVDRSEAAGVLHLSGATVLLYLWLGYLLFPFFPALSRTALRAKLAMLLSAQAWNVRDLPESFGGWLAASALLEGIIGKTWARRILPLLLLLIPLKLFIANRTVTASEVVGALAGVGAWSTCQVFPRPRLAAGVISVAVLVAGGLIPFHFTAIPQAFTWVPFLPLLQTPWEAGFLILFRKSFLYGSAVWLLQEGRQGWAISSLMVAVPLTIVEILQIFMPGRTPEVTDAALTLLLGFGLAQMERHGERPRLTPA